MSSRSAPPLPGPDAALFLDFDGTLAPIQLDPDAVSMPPHGAAILSALAEKLGGALAIISGRDMRDLIARTPDGLWRAGAHGLEICAPGENAEDAPLAAPPALVSALDLIAAGVDGARLEQKGPVLALHYRAAPEAGDTLAAAMAKVLDGVEGYVMQSGKMVHEAKPMHANKGRALAQLMERAPFAGRAPIMIGDDATDEDAIAYAIEAGGKGVKVGAGDSRAMFRLSDPDDVWRWLEAAAA